MLKYIYVFILIIILFWIKCKLQKKKNNKEEFETQEQIQLANMFSSSGDTFYDKISKLNSNIKYIYDDNCVMDVKDQLNIVDEIGDSILLRSVEQSLEFLKSRIFNRLKFDSDTLNLYRVYSMGLNIRFVNFSKFKTTYPHLTEPINTTINSLLNWHSHPIYTFSDYSGKRFKPQVDNLIAFHYNQTKSDCHRKCESDDSCVGFSIANTTPGNCSLRHTAISLDYTNNNYTTYLKPGTSSFPQFS